MLLFSRVATYRVVRGAGRARTGHTSVWGRTAVTRSADWISSRAWWGTHRVWSTLTSILLIGSGGVVSRVAGVAGVTPGGYLTTGVTPTPVVTGTATLLRWIPVGTRVCQVGWAARSAGAAAVVLRHRQGLTECRLPSRQSCWFSSEWPAVVGTCAGSNSRQWLTAGDAAWAGRRPRVRGTAMNPIDHPHGGGQGKTAGGRPGVTPWGRLTKGYKTVR